MSSVNASGLTEASSSLDMEITGSNSSLLPVGNKGAHLELNNCVLSDSSSTANVTPPSIKTMLPLVYVQTPNKLPFVTISKPISNNIVVNTVPPLQYSNVSPSTNKPNIIPAPTVPQTQNVILTTPSNIGRQQQIVIQKPGSNNKIPGTYLTMLKSVNKTAESPSNFQITANNSPLSHTVTTQKYVIAPSCLGQLQSNANVSQKYVITPITTKPSLLPRLSTLVTTPSKLGFMPLTIQTNTTDSTLGKYKVLNFKINDGVLQSDGNSAITVMRNSSVEPNEDKNMLICDEIIDLDSPEKNDNPEKGGEPIPLEVKSIKEIPKYPKHGVSILKKNYAFLDRFPSDKVINTVSNFISDETATNRQSVEETSVSNEPKTMTFVQKAGRRKSNFSVRKDYDDNNFIISTEPNASAPFESINLDSPNSTSASSSCETTKTKDVSECDDCETENADYRKMLSWNGGIGSLPGSEVKFILNEFDMIEYVTKDEYNKIVDVQNVSKVTKIKDELQEETRCLECGCFGILADFISPKYCSYGCQEAHESKTIKDKEFKVKRKKKPLTKKELDVIKNGRESFSDEESTSLENSQDRYSNPWACPKKGFSWSKYLDHVKAKAAPVKLFKDPFPYNRNGFRPGMKLEGVDPQHPSYFCVLTVAEVIGYRIKLHFDGYPNAYDFWINADSMNIFPVGWCEKFGHELHPPPPYTTATFNWVQYLKNTRSSAAPKQLFVNRAGSAICPNGFRVGMKLEAVDRKNTSLICVASVRDMMDNRILVHFDSWDDIYDYWADPTSPYIHPVGWADENGHNLTPPNDYPNKTEFTWETYLKETKAVAAPVRAFKQRPACGFKRGMRLECVDKRVPQLIRVATVEETKEHQIKIHFDGWLDKYSYWVDDDSLDIHPVGWCHKTGHPIESPLTPEDVYDVLECATIGCRGVGHALGLKYPTHNTITDCPYADVNLNKEKRLPDRLLSPDRKLEAVIPVSREPKEKPRVKMGRPAKCPRLENIKVEEPDELVFEERKPIRKYGRKRIQKNPSISEKILQIIDSTKKTQVEKEFWYTHSKFLNNYIRLEADPREWSVLEVASFLRKLPFGKSHADIFRENRIDGEALLLLTQKDIIDLLQIKLGPAIKIYNSIVLLRQSVSNRLFT